MDWSRFGGDRSCVVLVHKTLHSHSTTVDLAGYNRNSITHCTDLSWNFPVALTVNENSKQLSWDHKRGIDGRERALGTNEQASSWPNGPKHPPRFIISPLIPWY